jgi:hypothetical protein
MPLGLIFGRGALLM